MKQPLPKPTAAREPLFLDRLFDAFLRQEGRVLNNNPLNIWDDVNPPYKTKRIWPHLPIDKRGMIKYPTMEAGIKAGKHDLRVKIDHQLTLRGAITLFCPPTDKRNNTAIYIRNVSTWLGIPDDVPLSHLEALYNQGEIQLAA